MRRFWILMPAVFLYTSDITLTLAGQTPQYWAGDRTQTLEYNPIAYPILAAGPWLFLAAAVLWLVVFGILILRWRHRVAVWMAGLLAFAHTIGAATWIVRDFSWVAAVAFVVVAVELTAWCWRKASRG